MSMMPVVKETLKLLRASIPANIEIREDVDHESAAIMGNGTHIHQIVLNLATNACHAMIEQGGRLDVVLGETTFEVDTPISSSQVLMAGHYLQLSVADTGQGMREEVKERIFDPYFTTKKEGEGTGLGLAMVHGIVQEMRGGIVVDTEIGKGTRFDVYLPVVERSVSEISPSPHEDCPGGSERILIVDDEEPIANMVGIMLRDLGYHCTVMTETREALEHALDRSYTYDLIISDVAMPAMTGVEFARALADGGSDVPLILCSGYTGGINWRTAGAVGIHAMVMKPIIRSKLAQAVREVLDASVLAIPA